MHDHDGDEVPVRAAHHEVGGLKDEGLPTVVEKYRADRERYHPRAVSLVP